MKAIVLDWIDVAAPTPQPDRVWEIREIWHVLGNRACFAIFLSGWIAAGPCPAIGHPDACDPAAIDAGNPAHEAPGPATKPEDGESGGIQGFVLIPAGPFTMGRTSGDWIDNAPPVLVHVSAFHIATHEVTWALWNEVRALAVDKGYTDMAAGGGKGADHPVHSVSWWDAVKWCNARSEREGLAPVYHNEDGTVFRTGTMVPVVDWNANGHRLPTEAEWEKAARGGEVGRRFPWGDEIDHRHANYAANSGTFPFDTSTHTAWTWHPDYNDGVWPYVFTAPVGSFAPNGFGLYDMAGNVWEWCWDWYVAAAYEQGASDPQGPATGEWRVYRGGGWSKHAGACRAAARADRLPGTSNRDGGFRPARNAPP